MKSVSVEDKITTLDTFHDWQTARAEEQRAYNSVPSEINTNSPKQLHSQLGYLASKEEQIAARQTLMLEIASQDDTFLPITHRLGLLAAFDATNQPPTTKLHKDGSMTMKSFNFNSFRLDMNEQQLNPSSNPVKLASQAGEELERIRVLLDTRKNVPVVMVWNQRFDPPRMDYDEVVLGDLPNPRESFQLEVPKVNEIDGRKVVEYAIPSRLHGVKKGRIVRSDEYVQPEDKYKNPVITTLVRLGIVKSSFMLHDPDALYIGSKEVKERLAKAEIDKARYSRSMEGRRRTSSRLRRY